MKTKHLFFALAAPAIFAACSNEDIISTPTVTPGEQISTKGLVLKSTNEPQTRMGFDGKALLWHLGTTNDKLGVCYIANGQAHTNYLFETGSLFGTSGKEYKSAGDVTDKVDGMLKVIGEAYGPLASFKTENATIFGGTYLAYYPYDTEFKNVSNSIPVKVKEYQQVDVTATDDHYLGNNGFYVSDPFAIAGGDQAAGFTMRQVLPILKINLKNTGADVVISQVQVSAEGGMPVSASISASLTEAVAMKDLTIDKVNTASKISLIYGKQIDATKTQTLYITVMPGVYKNLSVTLSTVTGTSKTFPVAIGDTELKLTSMKNLPAIGEFIEFDASMFGGVNWSQPVEVATAAEFKAILTAASTNVGLSTIKLINDIEGNLTDLFDAANTYDNKSNIVVTGKSMLKINDAYQTVAGKAVKSITFENPVTFEDDFTTITTDNFTFKGLTTFKGDVVLTDAKMTIAGEASVATDKSIATATTKGALTIAKGGKLSVEKINATVAADAITVAAGGKLVVSGDATLGTDPIKLVANAKLTVLGELEIAKKANLVLVAGTYDFAGGVITNNGTIDVQADFLTDTKACSIANNGTLTVAFTVIGYMKGATVTNVTTAKYEVTGIAAVANMETASKLAGVNALKVTGAASGFTFVDAKIYDYSSFDVTIDVANNVEATVIVPTAKAVTFGTLNIKLNYSAAASTLTFVGNATPAAIVKATTLNIEGASSDLTNESVAFTKAAATACHGEFGTINVKKTNLTGDDVVTYTVASNLTDGATSTGVTKKK